LARLDIKIKRLMTDRGSCYRSKAFNKVCGQRFIQRLDAEASIHGVREPPVEHIARVLVHDRHQIQKAVLHRNLDDFGAPDLIGPRDGHASEQIGVNPVQASAIIRLPVQRLWLIHQYPGPHDQMLPTRCQRPQSDND